MPPPKAASSASAASKEIAFLYKMSPVKVSDQANYTMSRQKLQLFPFLPHEIILLAISVKMLYNSLEPAGVMELVDVVDSKSTAGDSVPVRVRSPAPIKAIVNDTFTMAFILCWKRTRTRSSGTVRWTVPATSTNTGGYLNFRQRRKCKSIPVPCSTPEDTPWECLLFCSNCSQKHLN